MTDLNDRLRPEAAQHPLLGAALTYAARGWPVLPLWWPTRDGSCACGNAHCGKSIAKHPLSAAVPNGVNNATTDPACITSWWRRFPKANVGIRTGRDSRLVVLDVDPRNGGDEGLETLENSIGTLPETPVSITGSLGAHYLFAYPDDGEHVPSRSNLGGLAGLDLKADGGYVVAPPSLHASGRSYAWNVILHPEDTALAPCPLPLLAMAREREQVAARIDYQPTGNDAAELSEHVAARVRGRLRARFNRESAGLFDTSPSGVDASLATLAALAGLAPEDVERVVRVSRAQAGLPPRGGSYYRATIGKALAFAEASGERAERYNALMLGGLRHA